MMRPLRNYILICFLCLTRLLSAQDPHFSQYFSSPLTFNPAFTGFFDGTDRLAVNYRSQWANVSTPYVTGTVSFDTRIMRQKIAVNDRWGLGVMGLYDQAGGGIYKNSYLAVSTGFHKGLDAEGNQSIGMGVQVVMARNMVDFGKISFSNQFTSNGFDLSVPSGETILNRTNNYFDVNAGLVYQYRDEDGNSYGFGASIYHLLAPKHSFFNGGNNNLPRRYTVHAGARLNTGVQDQVFIGLHVMQQAGNTMASIGAAYGFGLSGTDAYLYTGLWLRASDALYPYLGLQTQQYNIGLSYDLTHSDLRKANGFTGSSEVSFQYFFNRNKPRGIPCFF
jgi:type IX secretion system PorP/SprF family membrane protein